MKCLISAWLEKEGNVLSDNKLIRINEAKPEFGSLMLVSPTVEIAPGGFLNKRNKVAFIAGRVDDLEAVIEEYKLKAGMDYSKVFGEHKIVTVEKLESEVGPRDGFTEKINPTTNETLTFEGETIMRRTYLVPDGPDSQTDTLIQHDVEEVVVDTAVAEFEKAGKKE